MIYEIPWNFAPRDLAISTGNLLITSTRNADIPDPRIESRSLGFRSMPLLSQILNFFHPNCRLHVHFPPYVISNKKCLSTRLIICSPTCDASCKLLIAAFLHIPFDKFEGFLLPEFLQDFKSLRKELLHTPLAVIHQSRLSDETFGHTHSCSINPSTLCSESQL